MNDTDPRVTLALIGSAIVRDLDLIAVDLESTNPCCSCCDGKETYAALRAGVLKRLKLARAQAELLT